MHFFNQAYCLLFALTGIWFVSNLIETRSKEMGIVMAGILLVLLIVNILVAFDRPLKLPAKWIRRITISFLIMLSMILLIGLGDIWSIYLVLKNAEVLGQVLGITIAVLALTLPTYFNSFKLMAKHPLPKAKDDSLLDSDL